MAALPAPTPSPQLPSEGSHRYNTNLSVELAKCLQLVVPASMTADDRAAWLMAAVDALEDIRPDEVHAVSVEVRRSVTRAAQIVPEIARLVAERREQNSQRSMTFGPSLPPIPPRPPAPPLSWQELDTMRPQMISLGLKYGFLERREDGRLYETKAA